MISEDFSFDMVFNHEPLDQDIKHKQNINQDELYDHSQDNLEVYKKNQNLVKEEEKKEEDLLKPHQLYKLEFEFQSGGYGRLYYGKRITDNEKIIVKKINKNTINNWRVINIQDGIKIPNEIYIIKLLEPTKTSIKMVDSFKSKDNYYIVMEYVYGELDLWCLIQNNPMLGIDKIRIIFRNILYGIFEMKNSNILHGDVKDENILVNSDTLEIKFIDFGESVFYSSHVIFNKYNATQVYCPPEYFKNKCFFGDELYVWQIGHVLYNMLYRRTAFENTFQIKYKDFYLDTENESFECANDLILKCLEKDVTKRIKLNLIPFHKFF